MSSWHDQILRHLTPGITRVTLVADPDGLLLDEEILARIRERNFTLIPFEDPVAFRYLYESSHRARCDQGEQTDLVVILQSPLQNIANLPYDLLQSGRILAFNLSDIFPNLSHAVLSALDHSDFDVLFMALKRYKPNPLGENATKEFVLRHVFEIAPELIKQPADFLRTLLRRHYRNQRIPAVIGDRLVHLLRQDKTFSEWPLELILSDREAFLVFLQERWPIFLDGEARRQGIKVREWTETYTLTIAGPTDIPFDHQDIRGYMDSLFTEGLMQPVTHLHINSLAKSWAGVGIVAGRIDELSRRIDKLIVAVQPSIPGEEARHSEWFHFARQWAELVLLIHEPQQAQISNTWDQFKTLQSQIDGCFHVWLEKRYAGLVNLPPSPPVLLHHLPRFLARQSKNHREKIAMVMVDGLSLDHWLILRQELTAQNAHLRLHEQTIFAWAPTLTSISRQAAFSGKPPVYFPNSIFTTDKEPALWMQFWVDQGYSKNEIMYVKGLGDGAMESLAESFSHPKVHVVGLIIDRVDQIMHGMVLGTAGMHNQVRQWAQQGYLNTLLTLLLDHGFSIYLTSDHGNIEATGCERPAEGAVADLRGERVRIYSDEVLRTRIHNNFPGAIKWPGAGLPENFYPLIASHRKAFVGANERIVTHGGCSLEELIVPLVHIERKK